MFIAAAALKPGNNVRNYGILVDDPNPLYRDGLAEFDFGYYGVEVMSLDAEVFVILDA